MEEELKTNPQYTPVTCPRCGSQRIEFITEYHRYIGIRALAGVAGIIFLIFLIRCIGSSFQVQINISDLAGAIVSAVFYGIFQLAVWLGESKTHVQGICRDCGNIWLLD